MAADHALPSRPERSFPRRQAVTRRFTLGAPRSFRVSADGRLVWFLRSTAPDDPVHALWVYDLDEQAGERVMLDPRALGGEEDLPDAERARRERARETGEGIVAYALDRSGRRAVTVAGGRLVVIDAGTGARRTLDAAPGPFDPRLDPTGERVAYVADGALRVVSPDEADRVLIAEPEVTWGAGEFIAAEEFSRTRGFWWAPDGRALLVERVDESDVTEWHIASPVEPWSAPRTVRYPAAGTPNARCSLAVVNLEGGRVDVAWDTERYPYLLEVDWAAGPPTISVLTRDQRTCSLQTIDPATGECTEVQRLEDPAWIEPVAGTPTWFGGRLVTVADDLAEDTRRVLVDGAPLSPPGVQVRSVLDVGPTGVWVVASFDDPTETHLVRVGWDGEPERLTTTPGVHHGAVGGDTVVVVAAGMDRPGASVSIVTASADEPADLAAAPVLASAAEAPAVEVSVRFLELGDDGLRAALLLPSDGGDGPWPVLLDPYGGPHAQRVMRSYNAFAASQWFADQGFAVLVVDGRGTPGRGPAWERTVRGDLAGPVLDDQVDALLAAAEVEPRLDLGRVGIRGWSFGGYLAALAVLARPDVFHAAVAGAPVTDWRLYDTAYTERYLGLPGDEPANYERTDLTPLAPNLERPLMLIHGLADDNVVVAHSLQLSRALLEAGRPHTVLPLSGVTHMTPQEAVAENLLLLQVAFLREHLRG
jgi:dipeptidyl-peptidase 4